MIRDFVKKYIEEERNALDCISLDKFEEMIELLKCAYEGGRYIFIMGNGGSGATASHITSDINKGTCIGLRKKFKVICLNDNIPVMLAYANDNSYEDIFAEQLKNFLKSEDVVIGISGSGNSKNVIKAVKYANENNAVTVALTGFDGGMLAKIAKIPVVVPINDMQKVEDIHMMLMHIIMQFFNGNGR